MPEPEISKDQTGTATTRTRWEAIEITRVSGAGLRLSIPASSVTTLPDGSKVRDSLPPVSCPVAHLAHDAEAQQLFDLADKIAKRLLRGDLKPQEPKA